MDPRKAKKKKKKNWVPEFYTTISHSGKWEMKSFLERSDLVSKYRIMIFLFNINFKKIMRLLTQNDIFPKMPPNLINKNLNFY